MKSLILVSLFLLLFSEVINAQVYSTEFGKITQKEIDLKRYPSDTSAPAAVLYDMGKSYFVESVNGGFDVYFERATKIKIFTKAGFDYATIIVPYYQELNKPEQVDNIVAYTYNWVDGVLQKTELKKEAIFDEKGMENWRRKKFTLPEIHEGSIIEFKYTIKSPYVFNLQDWAFQSEIPVSYSKYIVKMIPFYTYTFLLQGAAKFSDYKSYENTGLNRRFAGIEFQDLVHEYTMINMPAFNDEKYITTANDYIVKIDFQLSKISRPDGTVDNVQTTWTALCNELLKNEYFGKYISACERKSEDILTQLSINGLPAKVQLNAIIDYVKKSYSFNGYNTMYAGQSVKEFIDTKTGSSGNINLFLLALLKKAGFEAVPVILSTRNHGKITVDFPFQHFFNYVVVLVNLEGKNILVDATEPLLSNYLIPPRCINERGLAVLKKNEQWVELTNLTPSSSDNNFSLEFNNTLDSLIGSFSFASTFYEALDLRNRINDKDENKLKFVEEKGFTLLGEIKTANFFETEKPYTISFKAEVPVDNINGKLYINPFFNETFKENPFKARERNYPVDFIYSQKKSFNVVIKIPEGYKATTLPSKTNSDNNLFSMNYNAEIIEKNIIIRADYYLKKPVYEAKDYQNVKFFFWDLVNQMNKKIVLEKVN